MGVDKGKKQKLGDAEEGNNGIEIDGELVLSIEKFQNIQDELEKINKEASEEVLEVEQTYNEIRKPVYDKRNNIIKSIPDFWLTAFMSHPALSELLTEEDKQIFKYLSNLEVEDCKDVKSGYSITFHFQPNPYFEDPKLTKTFNFLEEGTTKITATSIKWKEGMGIPDGVAEEKKGNKRSHAGESFFSWFNGTQHNGDLDEIQDEVAEIIKDDLWPNPLAYFNDTDINLPIAHEGNLSNSPSRCDLPMGTRVGAAAVAVDLLGASICESTEVTVLCPPAGPSTSASGLVESPQPHPRDSISSVEPPQPLLEAMIGQVTTLLAQPLDSLADQLEHLSSLLSRIGGSSGVMARAAVKSAVFSVASKVSGICWAYPVAISQLGEFEENLRAIAAVAGQHQSLEDRRTEARNSLNEVEGQIQRLQERRTQLISELEQIDSEQLCLLGEFPDAVSSRFRATAKVRSVQEALARIRGDLENAQVSWNHLLPGFLALLAESDADSAPPAAVTQT